MHADGGNTGSLDFTGPLGRNVTVSSAQHVIGPMLWGQNGALTMGFADLTSGASLPPLGIAAVNPVTLQVLATWFAPDANEKLNLQYIQLRQADNTFLVSSQQGRIYVVERHDCGTAAAFTLVRTIDLAKEAVLGTDESLLNSMFDVEGNIWFTTGGIAGINSTPQPSTTVGYVQLDGRIHSLHILDQVVENGVALNGTTMYLVTGPSNAASDQGSTTGYAMAVTLGNDSEITVLWKTPYSAGSGRKPGAFSRGSGSTPSLLADDYVVMTDNADDQVNLLVLYRKALSNATVQVHCKVPLFQPGASANDNRLTVHSDEAGHGVVISNMYNIPPIFLPGGTETDINGVHNDMNVMAGGIVRVDVSSSGCKLRWEVQEKMKSVAVLSTKSGLFYGYVQDTQLAAKGEYMWYAVAIDWATGDVVWKARAGAGGSYNDNFLPGSLGPDGTFYQGLLGGTIMFRDAQSHGY